MMPLVNQEPNGISSFRSWFTENGGSIHEDLYFFVDSLGLGVRTRTSLSSGTTAVSCPFTLAVTLDGIEGALEKSCRLSSEEQRKLTPRQRICAYIALHYIIGETEGENFLLRHRHYISILPKAEKLLTPMYFTEDELNLFRGTNLYGATVGQQELCTEEYQQLRAVIAVHSQNIAEKFTFNMYKLAWTYLSSRAFPSTMISSRPSLVATPESYPVLIPGIDILNHKRGQPVSWSVFRTETSESSSEARINQDNSNLSLALVMETPVAEGEELFNNYGPKPNSSLILAYGFTLADNPDDTILLKIGSSDASAKSGVVAGYEVGRKASGAQALWDDVRRIMINRSSAEDRKDEKYDEKEIDAAYEIQIDMETVGILSDMVSSLVARLPDLNSGYSPSAVRKEVYTMWNHYVRGQKDILEALLAWLEGKDREAVRSADELGISIVGDDSEDE